MSSKDGDQTVLDLLTPAMKIVVLTGAGISAESGIPTFRDAQEGLWAKFKPEELASVAGFKANPKLVFDWYTWRRELVLKAKPNKGHEVLARWGKRLPNFTLITQNVDGLHGAAGSEGVIEMHGSIHRLKCLGRSHPSPWVEAVGDEVTRCAKCKSLLRPDIVWFGENLDSGNIVKIGKALAKADLLISIGTSGNVYPAAGYIEHVQARGGFTVAINKSTDGQDHADLFLQGGAGEVLERLEDEL